MDNKTRLIMIIIDKNSTNITSVNNFYSHRYEYLYNFTNPLQYKGFFVIVNNASACA